MPDPKPPLPMYGCRGEEWQALQNAEDEANAASSPWLFRACLVGVGVVWVVLWWMG